MNRMAQVQNFIFYFALLILFFATCKNSNESESQNNVEKLDTLEVLFPDTVHQQRDSILNALYRLNKARFGDFDTLFKRRLIRVLLPYSRTLFFYDKSREYGISAEIIRDFELYINKKYKVKRKNIPITVVIIPTPRDELLLRLSQGMGDIAAGNLSATEERLKQVDFFTGEKEPILYEIPITQKSDDSLTNPEQLSGRKVHVRKSSRYYEHLVKLNEQLKVKHKAPIRIVTVAEDLEDEDLMEMLNAGILSTIIVDQWKSRLWAEIFSNIHLNNSAAIHSGGKNAWAIRKNSPKLLKELHDFYFKYETPNGIIPYLKKKYSTQIKQLQNPTNTENTKRYHQIILYFEKYGEIYKFDPLMLTALGFQESKLNQDARSAVGAVGVMQVMPKTGESMKVGSIYVTESNIHAGSKFLNKLMTDYFKDANFDHFNRSLFAFASYNAGPTRVAKLRRKAASRGLNPDIWLNNVEIIASEEIGQETTTYVRNIMKYYYTYKMMQEIKK